MENFLGYLIGFIIAGIIVIPPTVMIKKKFIRSHREKIVNKVIDSYLDEQRKAK